MSTNNYTPPLQAITDMRQAAYSTVSNATIKLGLLSFRYDTIKTNALSDSLLTVGTDNKFHDIPNRTASPYGTTRLFALTAFNEVALQPNVKFILPSQFYYQNLNESPSSIQLDCGDGQGLRTFGLNQAVNVNFSSGGEKVLTIRVTYPSGIYTSTTKIKVAGLSAQLANGLPPGDYIAPDEVWDIEGDSWTSTCDGSSGSNSGRAYIRFANGNRKLTKPIIFIDGIDFGREVTRDETRNDQIIGYGSVGWHNLASTEAISIKFPELKLFRELSDKAKLDGYDLIFLDFKDGADYIQRCAFVLKNLIVRINARKIQDATNGIVFPNVIIGPSMGGQVARFGLRYMEIAGINHCTSTYISFDSPHQGANIPMGIQDFIRYQGLELRNESAMQQWENSLNRPAVKQLLYQHRAEGSLCIRQQFEQERENLGYPRETRNVAISDGSLDAVGQAFGAGANMLDFRVSSDLVLWLRGKVVASNGDNSLVHEIKSPNRLVSAAVLAGACTAALIGGLVLSWITGGGSVIAGLAICTVLGLLGGLGALPISFLEHTWNMQPNSITADHVPGCTRGDIKDLAEKIDEGVPQVLQGFLTINKPSDNFCFMPTVSTLDIQNPPNGLFTNIRQLIPILNAPSKLITPFDRIYNLIEPQNLPHVQITPGMVTWVLEECESGFQREKSLASVYNYGFLKKELGGMTILSGGHLKINAPGATGFVATNPEPNAPRDFFEVITASTLCGSLNINIKSGGKLSLGEGNKSGGLRLKGGTTLTVETGGELKLTTASQLITASQLTIENGGKLIIEAGAVINLEGLTSRIVVKNGGELIINGQPVISGSGHFYFEAGNIYVQNSDLLILGTDRNIPKFVIGSGASVEHSTNFKLKFENCMVKKEGTANQPYLQCRNSASISAENVLFKAIRGNFNTSSNNFIHTYNVDDATLSYTDTDFEFRNCTFKDANTVFRLEDTRDKNLGTYFVNRDFGPISVEFWSCNFENTATAIFADRSRRIEFAHCNLNGCGIVAETTWFLFVRNTKIRGIASAIKTHDVGYLWVADGTVIDGGEQGGGQGAGIGINTRPDQRPSFVWNVLLMNDVTMQRCSIGVKLNGWVGATMGPNNVVNTGLLQMDCANMIDNGISIDAYDAIFSIYGRYSSNNASTQVGSNQFKRDSDYVNTFLGEQPFIRSVFQSRANPVKLDRFLNFSGNYWDGIPTSALYTRANFQLDTTRTHFTSTRYPWIGSLSLVNTITESDALKCGSLSLRNETVDTTWRTIVNVNGVLRDILVQQRAGYREIDNYDLESAVALLRPVAHLASNITDTANAQVKHLVEVARALALETPNSSGRADKGTAADGWVEASFMGYANPRTGMDIVVSPNPAHTTFQLELPEGEFMVSVFDAVGSRVYQKTVSFEPVLDIDVTKWQNALYLVEVVNTQTKEKTVRKIVVQH
jgi:hypothetical protein